MNETVQSTEHPLGAGPAAGVDQASRPAGAPRRARRRRPGPRPKHIPQRTCVACRQVAGKRSLVRVVRTPEGLVEVDPTGKKNGRGAYLHADPACWDAALKRKALQHALKTELSDQDRERLMIFRATLAPVDVNRQEERQAAQVAPTERR